MKLHEQIARYYPQYHTVEHYPSHLCAPIRSTKEEWGIFGNFYKANISVLGVSFDCTERLFHLMKFGAPEASFEGIRSEYEQRCGMGIKMHMKKIHREHPDWLRPDWGQMVVDAMRFCLQTKFEQCEPFRQALERSKGLPIVEDETLRRKGRDADSWGCVLTGDEYVGPNLLGRLLMDLRDHGKLEYTLPDDAFAFIDALKD